MTVDKRLLRVREKARKSRPKFRRQESWRYKRLNPSWRKPIGIDNTMRHHKRGWPKIVSVGYRGPRATRGLTKAGMEEVLVHNVTDIEAVEPKTQVARIASKVGVKKKVAITNRADELDVKIINRPEEALTFATISEISDELLLEEEDGKKKKKTDDKSGRKKRPSTALSAKELEELEKIELELGAKSTPKKKTPTTTAKKPTTTKKTTTTKKPTTTAKKPTTAKKTTTAKPKTSTTAKKSTSSKTTTSSKKSTTTKKATTTKKDTS